jgi:hypothetical protein
MRYSQKMFRENVPLMTEEGIAFFLTVYCSTRDKVILNSGPDLLQPCMLAGHLTTYHSPVHR